MRTALPADGPLQLRNIPGWADTLLRFGPAILVSCLGALTNLRTPGLYMDAVNPDYLVVRLLGSGATEPAWIIPGNLLFGLFPVMVQIYHGALPYWIGLPFYAVFGTGITGVRVVNMVLGLLVVLACGLFLRVFRVSPLRSALALTAMALDPGFVFMFRTQFYITALPLALVLTATAWVEARRMSPRAGLAFMAGGLCGLAVYGYFIYAFLLPAAAVQAAVCWWPQPERRRLLVAWVAGVAVGIAPYGLGLILLIIATGGPSQAIAFLKTNVHLLGISNGPQTLLARMLYFIEMVRDTVFGAGPITMMLHRTLLPTLPVVRLIVLLWLPLGGLAFAVRKKLASSGHLFILTIVAGVSTLFLVFGDRLWLHHMAMLLPALYIALALTLNSLGHGRGAVLASVVVLAVLIVGNTVDSQSVRSELKRTGGVGLASNAIEQFASDALHNHTPTDAFLPDWGVFMPFAMVTRGTIPIQTVFDPQLARQALCRGRDILVALVDFTDPTRPGKFADAIGWGEPSEADYLQRDGILVLKALRWHAAQRPAGACG